MKKNIFDDVMKGVMDRVDKAVDEMAGEYDNVKPFDKTPVSDKEIYQAYLTLTPQDRQDFYIKYGYETTLMFFQEIEAKARQQ